MDTGSTHRSSGKLAPVWTRELDDLPFGVALSADGRNVLWANRGWRELLGASRTAPVADTGPIHVFDHELDGELWTIRAVRLRLRGGPTHGMLALVAEDVTEAIFAGASPARDPIPAPLRIERFVPASALRSGASLVEQVVEPLWAPTLVLRGDPVRVAHANGAARAQYGFRLGEVVYYSTPLRLGGSLTSHFECMIGRGAAHATMPVRVWPSGPGADARLVMLDPPRPGSDLFEPILEGPARDLPTGE